MKKDMPTRGTIESAHFVVLERPVSVWEPEGSSTGLRFLRGMDPQYYQYLADVLGTDRANDPTDVTSKVGARSAQALRVAFGMGLESLFAILAALVQAPHCVFGWLSAYTNAELHEVVRRITRKEHLPALEPFTRPTWESISGLLLSPLKAANQTAHETLSLEFTKAWHSLAEVFCDDLCRAEYNCMKHGFRASSSGFSLKVEVPEEEGEGAKPLAHYDVPLGQTFPVLKRHKERGNYSVITGAVALEPQFCLAGLRITAYSMHNAVQFARLLGGDDPSKLKPTWPPDDGVFRQLENPSAPLRSLTYGVNVIPDKYLSKDEILELYQEVH